ncbi:unnamed protein product [Musa acuminata subsp. burmannicoides]|uniref:(wild Malaysian banana) hypothetical protein n=1 Tax=Musa acuminata subsp. malaccensis TaxID=214687 RepID=A0A804HMT8_MUSAM|nr:unnamed protein product [Musa acuminata subsp. malaccensis]
MNTIYNFVPSLPPEGTTRGLFLLNLWSQKANGIYTIYKQERDLCFL